jgi:3-dehydroquinate dehydratase-2
MSHLLLLNGPNLNLLGSREPGIYGAQTLSNVETGLSHEAERLGHRLSCFQSNQEGVLVDRIHQARQEGVDFILINAGAFTHTSIALRDALAGVAIPFIEVHISNVHARESFRHHSHLSAIAVGCIVGLGTLGYRLALQAAHERLTAK